MIDAYKNLLVSANGVNSFVLKPWGSVVRSFTKPETESIVPVVKRAFARNAKTAITAGYHFIEEIKLDLSDFILELVQSFQFGIKLDSDKVIGLSTKAISIAVSKSTNLNNISVAVTDLVKFASGNYSHSPPHAFFSL